MVEPAQLCQVAQLVATTVGPVAEVVHVGEAPLATPGEVAPGRGRAPPAAAPAGLTATVPELDVDRPRRCRRRAASTTDRRSPATDVAVRFAARHHPPSAPTAVADARARCGQLTTGGARSAARSTLTPSRSAAPDAVAATASGVTAALRRPVTARAALAHVDAHRRRTAFLRTERAGAAGTPPSRRSPQHQCRADAPAPTLLHVAGRRIIRRAPSRAAARAQPTLGADCVDLTHGIVGDRRARAHRPG